MKRIAIDMDEVLADTLSEHVARYNRDFQEAISKADLEGRWLWEIVPVERHAQLEAYLRSEDFFEDLPVMPDSQRVVKALTQKYEVFIASAAMEFPNSFGPKYRWLRRYFPFLPPTHFVFCGDKGILDADFLIDDQPRQLLRFRGKGILFSAPHNLRVTGFQRVHGWLEVEKLLL
ncbi:5' nucleotidase, NT5C type [Pseudacidobacterium ailaaui]|uniref:5' nucleotidase, NT5C type n=1 Tax=Pseudacidobacterium ailaaui TaxID=1382359 RepID=UPI00047D70F7|nr:5'-3'-deoxyribonucleotidase [Pseudacidobacterium ailaaui]MBX6359938.1 5'-3'-deoxyribonucleotidase [Pseudacidobacterium ailaaui]MDI3255275.1 5'-3'-deoxyribonucleotidase [Bacillota bacterium]